VSKPLVKAIVEDLEATLEEFREIAAELGNRRWEKLVNDQKAC
jgi:hypothetical protein